MLLRFVNLVLLVFRLVFEVLQTDYHLRSVSSVSFRNAFVRFVNFASLAFPASVRFVILARASSIHTIPVNLQ